MCRSDFVMSKQEFRINKVEYMNKTFRLPKQLVDELGKAANASGVSMNEFVIQAAEFALKNLVIEDGETTTSN